MEDFAKTLRREIEQIVGNFPPIEPENKAHYVGALTVCYHSMVASEPLLKLAASIPGKHQPYFIAHEAEERGHEKWMMKDILAIAGRMTMTPPQEIITMCGEMYYKVRHMGAEHLLGYMAVIEGFPNSPEMIERIERLYPEGSYTLAFHSRNDVGHYADLMKQIDHIHPDLEYQVTCSAVRTAELYHDALWHMIFENEGIL